MNFKLGTEDSSVGVAGNIVGVAAFDNVDIGETLCGREDMQALPFVAIAPPTVSMEISINDGPLAGQDGKNVTSRVVGERLKREMRTNISIRVEETDRAGVFNICARGAMQIPCSVELCARKLRKSSIKYESGFAARRNRSFSNRLKLILGISGRLVGSVMKIYGGAHIREWIVGTSKRTKITARMPTRGLIGFELELMNTTSGHGMFSHLFREYAPYCGEFVTTPSGRLVSIENGVSTRFALLILEERGRLFVEPQEQIYAGQIVGTKPNTHRESL